MGYLISSSVLIRSQSPLIFQHLYQDESSSSGFCFGLVASSWRWGRMNPGPNGIVMKLKWIFACANAEVGRSESFTFLDSQQSGHTKRTQGSRIFFCHDSDVGAEECGIRGFDPELQFWMYHTQTCELAEVKHSVDEFVWTSLNINRLMPLISIRGDSYNIYLHLVAVVSLWLCWQEKLVSFITTTNSLYLPPSYSSTNTTTNFKFGTKTTCQHNNNNTTHCPANGSYLTIQLISLTFVKFLYASCTSVGIYCRRK